jgi:2',3'-cyclic-nucleotide 2'-phosphodiesterase (5'-nucleotidase family)
MAITFSAVTKSESNALVTGGLINVSGLGANAEISAYSTVHRFLYTVGGGSGGIVVTDLRDPTLPKVVAKGNPDLNPGTGSPFQTLQSAAVFGNLLAVAVQNTVKTDPGFVEFFDISNPELPMSISTLTVGALPDMVKFSSDGTKLLVTNEGEPNSLYTIDPEGSISVVNTSGFLAPTPVAPAQTDVQTVGFGTWENRRAELINRGVRIGQRLGVTTTVAQDIEPEAIAISADGTTAWVSLQENNAIAVLDLSGAQPVISTIFSAGIKDWSRGGASATNTSFTLEYAAGSANQPAGVQAGGLSGLWFDGTEVVAGQALDIYYANTDRGPNGQLVAGRRQFLDPNFQPTIYKLGVNRASGAVSELGRIGLNRPDGSPLTGLPQLQGKDDIPIDSANNPLTYDAFGIDSETVSVLTVTISDSARKVFAVGDEYRGQIALFDFTTGNLIQRYIPSGQKAELQSQHGAVIGAETIDSLPAIYGSNRWSNRGIEGMAYNPTDGLLYAFMQSPLDKDANGTSASRSSSELTRILAIDPATGIPVKEHLYLLSGRTGQDKIGDVTFDAARGVFLVMERDSSRSLTGFKHVYEVDLRGATDTLPLTLASGGSSWTTVLGVDLPELLSNTRTLVDHDSNPATAPIYSTSSADRLAAAGIRLAHKQELFNLPSIGGTTAFDKPEGLTLRDDGALVVSYDNDFGTEGANGNALTVVSFDGAGLDSSDRDVDGTSGGGNQYRPLGGLPVQGLTMPDGIATYTDLLGRRFLLAAGEGDSREYQPDQGDVFTDLTRADAGASTVINGTAFRNHPGVVALNTAFQAATGITRTRLNLLNDTGDINGDGLIDKAYTIGSRSLRIFDDKGNVVFDSGKALEDLANTIGQRPVNRDDDKGTEPEMVEIATIDGRTYAFVALERTPTSVSALFDITDPYQVTTADPLVFSGAQRVEGLTFLRNTAGEVGGVVASSEGNDRVSVTTALPGRFTLQLLHLADGEAGLLAAETAPNLAALVDAFDGSVPNTLILAGGDNFIPGPFHNGGTDISVRDELNATTGSTITGNQPIAAVDIAVHNLIGVEASTIGNHEFDLGSRVFRDAINPASGWVGAQFPYLSANLDFSGDADLSSRFTNTVGAGLEEASSLKGRLVPSAVVTKGGQKIGLVGATTQILEQISSTGGVEVKGFAGDGAETNDMALLASQLQPVIDDLTSQGVNKIVLMAHLQQIQYEQQLAQLLKGVDIILAGGSNTRLGDDNDVAAVFNGHDATFAGPYPIVTSGADGGTTLIVNTDNEYTYLGRLVVDFNEAGEIVLGSLDTVINGAYAATDAAVAAAWNVAEADLATTAFATGTKGAKVAQLTGAVQDVIAAKDGQVWGHTSVYLEGERAFIRNQETNLGNISADANLAYARLVDPTVVVSLKNGGGIRAQIGSADVVSGDKLPPAANPAAGKPEGAVSTLDIENSLRFNNGLSLVTLTAAQFRQVVEHSLVGAGTSAGRFPQIGGFSLSYDLTRPEGSRVVTMAIDNEAGLSTDVIVRNGVLVGDPARSFRMVTLNFLAGGGDNYPFPSFSGLNRVDLLQATSSGPAIFSPDGSEQDALAEYLLATTSQAAPYSQADTPQALDQRLQNLAQRVDTVVDPPTLFLSALSADKAEGNTGSTPFTFTIQREGDPSVAVSVAWAVTASGSNPADALDFAGSALPSGVANLAAGQTSQQITLNVVGDGSFEADESFTLSLSNPLGGSLLPGAATANGRIQNDDVLTAPVYTFSKSADAVDEGSSLAIGVSTANVPAGSPIFWRFGGTGITAADFSDGLLEGSTALGSDGRAGFSKAIAADPDHDPNETLELRFFSDAAHTQQIGSTVSVLLRQPSVGLITDASDILIGTSADETLIGVPTGSTLRGQGALDRLTGGGANDLFVLGDATGRFYDDGTPGLGSADLALVTDFNAGDRIQLHGVASDYRLISGRYAGVAGVRIDALSPNPEAIGFVQGSTLASLNLANSSQFLFV